MTPRGAPIARGEPQAVPGERALRVAPPSDGELLSLARAGDRAAFGLLVERHHRTLAAILRQRAGRGAPLEDLVQEVFARTLVHVRTFRGDAGYLSWAATIGLNLATDWRRREETRRRLAPPAGVDPGDVASARHPEPYASAQTQEDVRRARAALDALPDTERLAITLRVVEEMEYEAVAERLGAPAPRVRQWVSRGLRRLRAALEERHGGR